MKRILIYQKNAPTIELTDDDNTKKEIYIKKLSSILSPDNNIVILETTSESIILRPSKITSISVTEDITELKDNIELEVKEDTEDIEEQKNEDIITDID